MNPWDIDPNFYLPAFRLLAARWRARRRRRNARVAPPVAAGCRG